MEKALRQYDIHFVGLKAGEHTFNYSISSDFFKLFEQPDFTQCSIDVQLIFEKQTSHFVLDFKLDGHISVDCDRCTANINYPVFSHYQLFVKFSDDRVPDSEVDTDEVLYIERSEHTLNIAQFIYEYVMLSMPMVKNCDFLEEKYKNCDKEILNKINASADNTSKDDDKTGGQWDQLKKLKIK